MSQVVVSPPSRVVTLIDLFAGKVTAWIVLVKSAPLWLQCETSNALSQECHARRAHSHPEGASKPPFMLSPCFPFTSLQLELG